jgi:hypothetical protein
LHNETIRKHPELLFKQVVHSCHSEIRNQGTAFHSQNKAEILFLLKRCSLYVAGGAGNKFPVIFKGNLLIEIT